MGKGIERWQLWRDKDDLIRCGGERITELSIFDANKHPILPPKNSDMASLLMMQAHQHGGVAQMWSDSGRNTGWLVVGHWQRRLSYMYCGRWKIGPFSLPGFPKLPRAKMQRAKALENAGLDYMGPLSVSRWGSRTTPFHMLSRQSYSYSSRWLRYSSWLTHRRLSGLYQKVDCTQRSTKFGLVQQCAAVPSSSRFVQRSEEVELRGGYNLSYFSDRGINRSSLSPYASWAGGLYARLIRLTKRAMRQATGRLILTERTLGVTVVEMEAVINSRLLVSLSEGGKMVLRKADFLSPRISLGVRLWSKEEDDSTWLTGNASMADKLLKRWWKTMNTLDKFCKTWYEEYLMGLRERTQITDKAKESPEQLWELEKLFWFVKSERQQAFGD